MADVPPVSVSGLLGDRIAVATQYVGYYSRRL